MKRWMNCALVGSLVCGTLSTSSSVAVDVDTQLNLLTAYRSHISYGGTVRDSLPEPFYGILNDMSHHLTKSCQNHECEEWAANGNGKRLPDDVLNILSEEIISFQNQKNLSLYAWNVFFFRLSVLLSIYPEMGYHPATYAGQEIPNDTTGRIYQYEGTDLFLDLYDTVRDLDTREKFNDVFYSQEKTKSFFAKRLLKPNPFYQHLGLNFIPNILDPDFFAKNPQTPLTFTVWGVDLTAEDINKMIAADVLPLGMSTEITPKFDGFKATPHGFWAHDFLHYVYNLKFSFREQIKVIYNSVTYSPYKQHHFSVPRSFSYFDFPKQSISMTEVLHVMFFLWQHEIAEYNDHESPEKSFDLSFGDIHREIGDEDSTLPRNLVTFFEILKEKGLMKEKSCGDEGAYCDAALSSPGAKWELYGLLNMWLHQFKRYVFP